MAIIDSLKFNKGPLQDSLNLGIDVFVSSPLEGGQLMKLSSTAIFDKISSSATPAQICLLFASFHPAVKYVLTSPTTTQQLYDTLKSFKIPAFKLEEMNNIIELIND